MKRLRLDLLFNIYPYMIVGGIQYCQCQFYTDDFQMYFQFNGHNIDRAMHKINGDLRPVVCQRSMY